LLNLTAGIIGSYPTTYMAHAGGFLAGMFLATLLLIFKVADCDDTGQSLLRIIRPSLYKADIYESYNLSQQAALVTERRPVITTGFRFKVDEVKQGRQAQNGKKPVLE
jgi:hypothetical protein